MQEADADKIGRASLVLGAGRAKTTDVIDSAAGLSGLVKIGERVEAGQPLATLHAATRERIEAALPWVRQAFVVGNQPVVESPLVLEKIFTTRCAGENGGLREREDEENVSAFSFGSTRAKNAETPSWRKRG